MKEGVLDKSYFGRVVEAYDQARGADPTTVRREIAEKLRVTTGSLDQVQQLESHRLIKEGKLTIPTLKYLYTALQKIVRSQLTEMGENFGKLRAPGFTIKMLNLLREQLSLSGAQITLTEGRELTEEEYHILTMGWNLWQREKAYLIDLIDSVISDMENEELVALTKVRVESVMWN